MISCVRRRAFLAIITSAILFANPIVAQPQTPSKRFELTVDSIMRGPDLVGYEPTEIYWSQDGLRVYFRWKRAGEPRLAEMDLYVVNRDGRGLRKLSEEEARTIVPPAAGELSKDKKLTVFTEDGDVYLYDHTTGGRRPLTNTTEIESNAHFTGDQTGVYFTRQNNLYVLALGGSGGSLSQLTDIRIGGGAGTGQQQPQQQQPQQQQQQGSVSPPPPTTATSDPPRQQRAAESQEVLKREERELLETVRERAARREEQEAKRRRREKRKPLQLPAGQGVNLSLAPDGRYVIATINESASGAKNTVVPNYVTETAYTEQIPSRTKVGDAQPRTRMAVIDVSTGETKWVTHAAQDVDVAPRIRARTEGGAIEQQQDGTRRGGVNPPPPRQAQTTEAALPRQAHDREVQLFSLQWSASGERAALLARSTDNKDRWVLLLDPTAGTTKVLARIHDEAWVGGPGAATLGWLPDNKHVYFQSERDGYAHLYTVSTTGGAPVQLTSGAFELFNVRLSEDKSRFYFTSSEADFGERHFYSMPIGGGARTRIATVSGNNEVSVSPDESMLAIVRSSGNRPPELYLAPNRPGPDAGVKVTTSPIPEFFTYNWIDPPIVSFKARDGAIVRARLYKPANYRKGGPAVVFVHGAGYLQNVHRWWSSYYREYMFHHLLMERGYIIIDVDYRGSAGYGRDWRTGIYRHMGGKDLTDHTDAVRYLISEHGVDPRRVGIYGGSYGGFITFMAMFTQPGVFAAGAALRPVTDWAHYNHPYTSNILNLPQNDLAAYKRSSPIYFAEGLKGALLICHGMVDSNVHFQDTVRLVQRLIELRKENWELAVYPVEDHAFERASSWADEYKRILKLFTEHLRPAHESGSPPAVGGAGAPPAVGR